MTVARAKSQQIGHSEALPASCQLSDETASWQPSEIRSDPNSRAAMNSVVIIDWRLKYLGKADASCNHFSPLLSHQKLSQVSLPPYL
jgi:hypothetical protein